MDCECRYWARNNSKLATEHHPRCTKYDPEGDARKIIETLVRGIEIWARDEDGVHDQCWEAYKNAKFFIYQPLTGRDLTIK